ncbi:MAG: DUF4249 family protein [Bacteroidetes bacterium]|nr:DUF4249 family protein [Bacteroidota bacterium]
MRRLYLYSSVVILGLSVLFLASCETDITVDLPQAEQKIVVEGSIEPGMPPFILLTRSAPFFGSFDPNNLAEFFVRDAVITINDGTADYTLIELCLSELPEEFQALAAELLGVTEDSLSTFPEICLYTVDLFGGSLLLGQPGKTYRVSISVEGETLTATTYLPFPVAPDSIFARPHPDPAVDSLFRLSIRFSDPDTLGNYYRYWTRRYNASRDVDEPFYPGVSSVIDDLFFNGQTVDFSLDRGQPRSAGFDQDTYGFFWAGDTVVLKLASIDRPVYSFWSTLEFDAGSGGPFSSATVVSSNIQGGLGVFGGYGASYDTLIIGE